ncbi:MAG: VanW family protein [Clostridia bacterium]|nr:VanW family protein [Clostridia bacterium]
MKINKNFFKMLISVSTVVIIGIAIFLFTLLSGTANDFDLQNKNYENTPIDEIVDQKLLKNNLNKSVELIFGDNTYTLKENIIDNLTSISNDLYMPAQNAKVIFNPDNDEVFVFEDEVVGRQVDVTNLAYYIKDNLENNRQNQIVIPTTSIEPEITKKELEGLIRLRSQFSTSVATSPANRKHNVGYALKAFNGLVVMPDEIVSFNKTTGDRNFNSNYKEATIIMQGEFVQGLGGGVCQASTTLYNALLRADIEVLRVNNHSLPVGYVSLGFDAMVNDTSSDLIFKNNTGSPLYFMTNVDEETATVKIFGTPLEEGLTIETKSEFIKEIPHKGDKIIPDTNGKYANKILYKGEYLRLKQPQNGKECKGYLQYFKNGELIKTKEVRHVYYQGAEGIIMEGTEELYEGMSLPKNTVKFFTPTAE